MNPKPGKSEFSNCNRWKGDFFSVQLEGHVDESLDLLEDKPPISWGQWNLENEANMQREVERRGHRESDLKGSSTSDLHGLVAKGNTFCFHLD